jgi:hypothetical protein
MEPLDNRSYVQRLLAMDYFVPAWEVRQDEARRPSKSGSEAPPKPPVKGDEPQCL